MVLVDLSQNSWRVATSNEILVICHDFTMCSSMKLHASHMAVAIAMPKSTNNTIILLVALPGRNLLTSYIRVDKMISCLALCSIPLTTGKTYLYSNTENVMDKLLSSLLYNT